MNPLWRERRFLSACIECGSPIPKGKRKCAKHLKGMRKITGRPVNKGRNARGIAAHKPVKSYTRQAKRQNTAGLGMQPKDLKAYNFGR